MINKIKEWIFLNYGVQIPKRFVWMGLFFVVSAVLLIIALSSLNWSVKGSGKAYDPGNMPIIPQIQKKGSVWTTTPNMPGQ